MTEMNTTEKGDNSPAEVKNHSRESAWAKPVDRLSVKDVSKQAINQNVEGRGLTGPLQGFGQLWQKTYQIRLVGADVTSSEVVDFWKKNLPHLMPDDSRFYPSIAGVEPGEVLVINATLPGIPGGMPVSIGVMILYADDEMFTVMTPDGHPESGFNTFSAFSEDGVTTAQIQSLARANDPIFEFGFRYLGGSKQQENIWRHVLTHLAEHFNVEGQFSVKKVCLDSKMQWSYAKNVWHNSIIRTTIKSPGRVIKQVFGRE
jgi:hypothetical protein